jgi:erythromycin esterase
MRNHLFILLVLVVLSTNIRAQDEYCDVMKKYSIELSKEDKIEQFGFLDSILRNAKILSLGENTHGSHEFFTSKFQIIKYCITNLNYSTIGIESDYAGTQIANDYIQKGIGTPENAVYNMGISAWMTKEMREILEWLKQTNTSKTDQNKISIYGFDMQFPKPTLSKLKLELLQLNYSSVSDLDTLLNSKSLMQINKEYLDKLTYEIREFANLQNDTIKNKLLGLVHSMITSINYLSINDEYQRANFRDKFMSENILNSHKIKQGKTIIWAHNEHITQKGNYGNWQTMGEHLKNELGSAYYSIGLLTSNGHLGFYNKITRSADSLNIPVDNSNSYESIFKACDLPCFFIDLTQSKQNSSIQNLFSKNKSVSTIDLVYDMKKKEYNVKKNIFKNNLLDKFDGIIFIETTTAAKH